MSKLVYITGRLYNFHKDNYKAILMALVINYLYALCMVSVAVTIYIGYLPLVILALLLGYTMFTIVTNRPKYETIYGKALMVFACTAGGTTSYLIGEYIKTII